MTAAAASSTRHCPSVEDHLRALGARIPPPVERSFHGVLCPLGAAIVLHPSFAPCAVALKSKLPRPQQLAISPTTIDTYRRRVGEKLGLKSRAEMVKYCLRHGLLSG